MATSGITINTISRDDIIKAALRKLSALAQGQTPSTEDYTNGAFALNLLAKEYQTLGMPLWKRTNYTFAPTLATAQYLIGVGQTLNTPFPLKMYQAYVTDTTSNTRTPIEIISHQSYYMLPSNSSSGRTIQLMYQPMRTYGKINVWPTPDSSAVANTTITIIYQAPFETFVASSDEPDFPEEWGNALIYGLAKDLAPEWSIALDSRKMLLEEAKQHLEIATSFGTEEASLYWQPDTRHG